jgi:flagellar biosynthesis protein FlgN
MNTQSNNMKHVLDQIADSTTELLQCLIKEHDALSLNQLDKLVPLSEQKQLLVAKLDQLDQLRQANSNQTTGNSSKFIEHLNGLDSKLASYWRSITRSVEKCQRQNEVNGRLLNRQNSLARETLEIFIGRKQGNSHTYGANGLQSGNASIATNVEV